MLAQQRWTLWDIRIDSRSVATIYHSRSPKAARLIQLDRCYGYVARAYTVPELPGGGIGGRLAQIVERTQHARLVSWLLWQISRRLYQRSGLCAARMRLRRTLNLVSKKEPMSMNNSQQPSVLDHPGARSQPGTVRGRPVGVTLVTIMFVFYAIVVGFNAFSAFQALSVPSLSATARADARLDLILSLAQLPFYVVTALGVWRLQQWGHYLALIFLGLNIGRFVVEAFSFPTLGFGLLAALSRSIIPITIMLYLLHPSIRPVFRRGRAQKV